MSRVKSSRVMVTDFVRQRQNKRHDGTIISNQDFSISGVNASVVQVPDIRINPKQADGYRSPSDYHAVVRSSYPYKTSALQSGFLVNLDIPLQTHVVSGTYGNQTTDYSGNVVGLIKYLESPDTWSLEQQARAKILNNIKDQSFDVAMVLAEIGDTASTAANLMLRIGRSMDAIRRGKPESFNWLMHGKMGADNRRPTDKFLRETANIFLEWKYGIMPTVYDLEGASKSLDAARDGSMFDHPPLMVARANVKQERPLRGLLNVEHGFGTSQSLGLTCETSIACRADFTVTGDAMRGLSEHGIGLTSLATVAYDKTPFSFVANMVVPMSEIISAWGALAGVHVRGYTETTYHKYKWPGTRVTARVRNTGEVVSAVLEEGTANEFTRSGSSSIPMPLPFIRNPVKVNNVQTVLALFTQLRARPKREPRIYGFNVKDL